MKKVLYALLCVGLFCGGAGADVKVGFLTRLNVTEDEYQDMVIAERKTAGWQLLSTKHEGEVDFVFYDSLIEMQMGLIGGYIDEAALPKVVAEYLLNTAPGFAVASAEQVEPVCLAFGFRPDSVALRDSFNTALRDMKTDGTLAALTEKYLAEPGMNAPASVEFERFDSGETIWVAVTGDLPPLDFVAEGGMPAGFNTAILAEISRRLRRNIELFDISTGGRSAALASGRTDVVFWYRITPGEGRQIDVPEGILFSEPYYEWDKFLYIKKK